MIYVVGPLEVYPSRVKIGYTSDSSAYPRLAALQTGSPLLLGLHWTCNGGRDREQWLHRNFSYNRVHGEWFDFPDQDPIPVIQKALEWNFRDIGGTYYELAWPEYTPRYIPGANKDETAQQQTIEMLVSKVNELQHQVEHMNDSRIEELQKEVERLKDEVDEGYLSITHLENQLNRKSRRSPYYPTDDF